MNLKLFLASALWIAGLLLSARAGSDNEQSATVTLSENSRAFILDNGRLRAEIEKRSGNLVSLTFRGQELLAQNGGYWSSVGRGNGNRLPGRAACVITNTPERVEVSCRAGNLMGITNIPLDTDFRYSLARGETMIHVTGILHHEPGTGSYGTGESRYCLKLNPQVFDFLSVDPQRQRQMPSGYDWDHGSPLNLKEARRMTTGIHKGEAEHKYDYAAAFTEAPAYGWSSTQKKIGLWLINPSFEYLGGGPTKVELTGHLDVNAGGTPTLLNMWQGSHYGGTALAIAADERWTKVIGPFAIYCNAAETPAAMWRDGLRQATNEQQRWPYAWFVHPDFPSAAERGALAGQIILRDPFSPATGVSNLWVGVSAPDYRPPPPRLNDGNRRAYGTNGPALNATNRVNRYGFPTLIDWQRDTKFYQFWTRADAEGNFRLKNVRPGNYTLHAFGDGVIGEFSRTNVTVPAGALTKLGELVWQPERFGRTLWEIGVPDRTAREFRHGDHYWQWGLYYEYAKEFPEGVHFIVGQSDWRRDWNYAQPPLFNGGNHPVVSEEDEAERDNADRSQTFRNHGITDSTWKIQFQFTNAPGREATLRLAFAGARDGCLITVGVNGEKIGDTGQLPATGVMHRDGIRGYWFERRLTFDAQRLRPGTNVITLTSKADNWTQGVLYDCVRLELK